MRKKSLLIRVSTIEFFFLIFPYFLSFLDMIRPAHMEDLFFFCVFLGGISVTIKFIRSKRIPSPTELFILASIVWVLFTTIISKNNLKDALIYLLPIAVFTLLLDFHAAYDIKRTMNVLLLCFEIVLYMDLLSIILYPHGMSVNSSGAKRWLLGHYGAHLRWYCPAFAVCLINIKLKQNSLRSCILAFLIATTTYYIGSATLMVAMTLYFVILLVPYLRAHMNYVWAFIANILFLIMVLVLKNQEIFAHFIVDILHKDLTFTGRVYIWEAAILRIIQRPFLGCGETYSMAVLSVGTVFHAHNEYLDILIRGGIIALVMYVMQNYVADSALRRARVKTFVNIIRPAIFAMLFAGCSEVLFSIPIPYLLFILAQHVDRLNAQIERGLVS